MSALPERLALPHDVSVLVPLVESDTDEHPEAEEERVGDTLALGERVPDRVTLDVPLTLDNALPLRLALLQRDTLPVADAHRVCEGEDVIDASALGDVLTLTHGLELGDTLGEAVELASELPLRDELEQPVADLEPLAVAETLGERVSDGEMLGELLALVAALPERLALPLRDTLGVALVHAVNDELPESVRAPLPLRDTDEQGELLGDTDGDRDGEGHADGVRVGTGVRVRVACPEPLRDPEGDAETDARPEPLRLSDGDALLQPLTEALPERETTESVAETDGLLETERVTEGDAEALTEKELEELTVKEEAPLLLPLTDSVSEGDELLDATALAVRDTLLLPVGDKQAEGLVDAHALARDDALAEDDRHNELDAVGERNELPERLALLHDELLACALAELVATGVLVSVAPLETLFERVLNTVVDTDADGLTEGLGEALCGTDKVGDMDTEDDTETD